MNSRMGNYSPRLLPTHTSPTYKQQPTTLKQSHSHRHWKQYLSKEVDDHYHNLKQKPSQKDTPIHYHNHSQIIYQSPSHSHLSKSDAKSLTTHWDLSTPKKQVQLGIHSPSCLSSSLHPQPDYRLQLIEEQCKYLRQNYISHCLKNHRPHFYD